MTTTRQCNTRIAAPMDPFAGSYLQAIGEGVTARLLPIGPFMPQGDWLSRLSWLSGEMAERYVSVVISPLGAPLGIPKSSADFAPDKADQNPQLAQQHPDLAAAAEQANAKDLAYAPPTALQGLYVEGQTNIALLRPIRAKRLQLQVDLEILKTYNLVLSPSDVVERYRALGIDAIPCDPDRFHATIESQLP